MKTLGFTLLHWECFGTEHSWHWIFPAFFFLMFLCFIFGVWRRRKYSCGWPGWYRYSEYPKTEAKDIIKKRYANGEINKEEFDRLMKDISKETEI